MQGDSINGRGWLDMKDAGVAEGRLFIHFGEESALKLEKS